MQAAGLSSINGNTLYIVYQSPDILCFLAAKELSCASHYVVDLGKACSVHIQEKPRQKSNHFAVWKIYAFINIQPLTCLCMEPDLIW